MATAEELTFILRARNDAKKASREFGRDVRTSARDMKRVADESRKTAAEFNKTNPQVRLMRDRLAQSLRETRKLKGEVRALSAAAAKSAGSFALITSALRASLGLIGTFGGAFTAAFALGDAISTARGFENAMSEVRAVSQLTAEQFEVISNRARELGATTNFSAREAAEGMSFLARAGFDAQQTFEAIPTALKLAQAGNLDLASSADIASNILSGLQLDVAEFNRVGDVLAFTAANANTNIQQLGGAFSFVAPVAATLGISVEDLAAGIGVLSDAGIQGFRSGTNLRGLFGRLQQITPKAAKVFREFGIDVAKVNPATNDLADILEELAPLTSDAAVKAGALGKAFGVELSSGVAALIGSRGRFTELREGARGAAGSLDALAQVMTDNLDGAVKELRSAVEELYLALVDTGLLQQFVQFLTAIVRAVTPAREGLTALADGARDTATFTEELNKRVEELRRRAAAFVEVAEDVVAVFKGLGAALAVFLGGKLVVALAGIVTGLRNVAAAATFANLAVNANPIIRLLTLAVGLATTLYGIFQDVNEETADTALNVARINLEQARRRLSDAKTSSAAANFDSPQNRLGVADPTANFSDLRAEVERANAAYDEALTQAVARSLGQRESNVPGVVRVELDDPDTPTSIEGTGQVRVDVIRDLAREIGNLKTVEGELGRERARSLEALDLIAQAEMRNTDANREGLKVILRRRDELQGRAAVADSIDETVNSLRAEADAIKAGITVRQEDKLVYDAFIEARRRGVSLTDEQIELLRREGAELERVRRESKGFGQDLVAALEDVASQGIEIASVVSDVVKGISSALSDSIISMLDGGEAKIGDFILSLRNQIIQFFTNQAVMMLFSGLVNGAISSNLFGSSLPTNSQDLSFIGGQTALGFPRAAYGADFVVGSGNGRGGVDSQMVSFMASPGERVRVTRPEDDRGGGGGGVVNNFTFNLPNIRTAEDARQSRSQLSAAVARAAAAGRRNL